MDDKLKLIKAILDGDVTGHEQELISLIADDHGRKPLDQPPTNGFCQYIGQYVIARTYSAGVFAGTLVRKSGKEVLLSDARRLWRWSGAASLSELAIRGVGKPDDCKFPAAVASVHLLETIEILPCTEQAKESIERVPEWTAR